MNEQVKMYLEEEKKKQEALLKTKKEKDLISRGLVEKEFTNATTDTEEYPNRTDDGRYFKIISTDVSDDEYHLISQIPKDQGKFNLQIENILGIIGWVVIISGVIIGGNLGRISEREFSFAIAITYWGISFISGVLFLGFSEIIKLLKKILNTQNI